MDRCSCASPQSTKRGMKEHHKDKLQTETRGPPPRERGILSKFQHHAGASTAQEVAATEYAAAVEDRWQGRGLGLLTRHLIQAALKQGVSAFTGIVLPENARMLNLLRNLGLPERLRYESAVEYVELDLSPSRNIPGYPVGPTD